MTQSWSDRGRRWSSWGATAVRSGSLRWPNASAGGPEGHLPVATPGHALMTRYARGDVVAGLP